jgi:hypothetical protein
LPPSFHFGVAGPPGRLVHGSFGEGKSRTVKVKNASSQKPDRKRLSDNARMFVRGFRL